jgi:hypothetical protein
VGGRIDDLCVGAWGSDASRARTDAVWWDFSTQVCASSSQSRWDNDLDRTLEECQTLLCLQETVLEVWEALLVEELERGLHPPNKRDLSVELDKAHAHVDRIDGERATKVERLPWHVMQISGVLVDLGMMPIQDTPQLLK